MSASQEGAQPPVSAVVVTYNTASLVGACLSGLQATGGVISEVILVDNASTDGTREMVLREFPTVRLIQNERNVGFGSAINQGVRAARGELVLLLNSDALVSAGAVQHLATELRRNPRAGVVGPRLLNADGVVQPSAFRFPRPRVSFLRLAGLSRFWPILTPRMSDAVGSVRVDWLIAACLLGRTELLRQFGPFDTAFFMYGEDIDLCYRLRQAGWETRLAPRATVTHLGGQTTRLYHERMALESVRSMYLFYGKHWPTQVKSIRRIFAVMAIAKWSRDAFRLLGALLMRDDRRIAMLRRDLSVWAAILRLPASDIGE